MTKLTADTITREQIRDLRNEALAASDYVTVDMCDVALAAHEAADSEGNPLFASDGKPTTRTEAREACADAINASRDDGPTIRHYRSEDGISGYSEGEILVNDTTGERILVVRDGRGLCLTPYTSEVQS